MHFDNYPLLHHHARNISKSVIAIISYASFWIQLEQLKLHNKQKASMEFQIKRLTFIFSLGEQNSIDNDEEGEETDFLNMRGSGQNSFV